MYSPMRERRSTLGRLAWWSFWVVVLVYVLNDPSEAAGSVRALWAGVEGAAESVIMFFQQAGGSR